MGRQGLMVQAAMFNGASSQFLNIADNAALSMGAGVHPTLVFWVYFGGSASSILMSKATNGTAATIEYRVESNAGGQFRFRSSNGAALSATGFTPPPSPNIWLFVAAQHDGTNETLSVNNGPPVTTSVAFDIQDSTGAFRIGMNPDGASPFSGAINQVGIAKSILSAAELTELWNGGKGKSFSQLSAALAAKFTAYWDLDDAGGSGATWLDKAGTSHLTAGTTTAAPTAVVLRR
jgi:hypothetical protein